MAIVKPEKPNPNEKLKLGAAGAELIKSFESCVLKAYVDTHDSKGNEVYAIGWGHTSALGNPHVHKDMVITQKQADEIFLNDATIFENKVKHYVKVPLTQNQFDALVCCCYNVSTKHFEELIKTSQINKGVYDKMPDALMVWVKSGDKVLRGLVRRRKAEGALWSKK